MYWHLLISAIVWFPLAVMTICYSAIFLKLDRYEQKVLRRENPISVSYKTKVAKMMFTVLIVFVLCRVPFTALIFVRNQMLKETKVNQVQGAFTTLWYCSHYLMFCNAAINPIIYGLTNDNFRKAYKKTPLIKLFCKSTAPGEGQGGLAQGRKQRIKNMLLGNPLKKSEKGAVGKTKNIDHETQETSSSGVWHTRKSIVEASPPKISTMATNLPDNATTDPRDYEIMENLESHVELETEKGQSTSPDKGSNFI